MKVASLFILLFVLLQRKPIYNDEEVVINKIASIVLLKDSIMTKAWPATADTAFDIPFIYYAGSFCYAINPKNRFIQEYRPALIFRNDRLTIYKMQSRPDNIPFHMETRVSDMKDDYNFNFPYAKVSSLEEVRTFNAALTVQEWSGMVLHELFHGYQFRHSSFWQHAFDHKLIFSAINDSLQSYYRNHAWYKQKIDQENDLILQAIAEKTETKRKNMVIKMLGIRDERRKMATEKLNRPIEFYEPAFETMEGTARYIEVAVINSFHKVKMPDKLVQLDSNYSTVSRPIMMPEWAYKTEVSQSYTYAMGYNMTQLLEVSGYNYKSLLFNNPELTLEKILRQSVE